MSFIIFPVVIYIHDHIFSKSFVRNTAGRDQHPIFITRTHISRRPLIQSKAGHFKAGFNDFSRQTHSFHNDSPGTVSPRLYCEKCSRRVRRVRFQIQAATERIYSGSVGRFIYSGVLRLSYALNKFHLNFYSFFNWLVINSTHHHIERFFRPNIFILLH